MEKYNYPKGGYSIPETSLKDWRKIGERHLADYGIFSIRRVESESPRTGKTIPFQILECGLWTNVFPVTPNHEVVMIRQYRHGTEKITLEIPGGLVERGESPAHAARREMVEETGYDSETIVPLGYVEPNPAFISNSCHTFLAPGAASVGRQSLDHGEDIEVVTVPMDRLGTLVADGTITHSLVVAAIYLLELHIRQHPDWNGI
ncbi:MAG TPA: NUDIX hydrolase [bacterium]|nr:NUDIX hydrolase [bacterium]